MRENVWKNKKMLFRMRGPKLVGRCSAAQSEPELEPGEDI